MFFIYTILIWFEVEMNVETQQQQQQQLYVERGNIFDGHTKNV